MSQDPSFISKRYQVTSNKKKEDSIPENIFTIGCKNKTIGEILYG
jgi:hypothetical protein